MKRVGWVAGIWRPDDGAVARVGAAWSRRALEDQGAYARATPFDVLVGGPEPAPGIEWPMLGGRVLAWIVDETVVIEAAAPPVVTMVSLMRRRPTIGHDEFVDHWRKRHAPIAKRRHVGLVDYRQCVVTETATSDTPEIDGIAFLGFGSREDFETRFFDSDEGRAEVVADVARFMDRPGPETTLVGPPEPDGVAG